MVAGNFTANRVVGNEAEAVSDVSVTDGVQKARAYRFHCQQWEDGEDG
jgi:hypothetical protein